MSARTVSECIRFYSQFPPVLNPGGRLRLICELAKVATWKPHQKLVALLVPDPSDIQQLKGIVMAPTGCPMEGYIYFLDIYVPMEYPFGPPRVRFETPVWFPKLNLDNRHICLGILVDFWKPHFKIDTVLVCVATIFTEPGVIEGGGI